MTFSMLAKTGFVCLGDGYMKTHRVVFQIYLPWPKEVPDDPLSGATVISLLVFFSYAIVLNTVVPISLYVR